MIGWRLPSDAPSGQGDIDPFSQEDIILLEASLPNPLSIGGERLLYFIAALAEFRSLFGRHTADIAQQSRQQTLPAQIFGADRQELLFRFGFPELGLRLFLEARPALPS